MLGDSSISEQEPQVSTGNISNASPESMSRTSSCWIFVSRTQRTVIRKAAPAPPPSNLRHLGSTLRQHICFRNIGLVKSFFLVAFASEQGKTNLFWSKPLLLPQVPLLKPFLTKSECFLVPDQRVLLLAS